MLKHDNAPSRFAVDLKCKVRGAAGPADAAAGRFNGVVVIALDGRGGVARGERCTLR